jgi:Ca-activated chloride channel family protein
MLQFAHPWLFALLPLPLLVWRLLPPYRQSRTAVRVPDLPRLSRMTGQEPGPGAAVARRSGPQYVLLILVWAAVVASLARPQWTEEPVTKTVPTRDLLLAVDLSGSMETRDFTDPGGLQVDRLTAVKQVLDEFLTRREGDRVGLIVFGTAAFVQAPFTDDLQVVRTMLDEVEVRMAGPKTVVGDAIGLAMTVFERSEVQERVLILLTDGNDTGSLVPPVRAAEIARDKEIVIHAVAVGDPGAAGEEKLDTEVLESIARTTGGRYFFAADRQELEQIYTQLDQLNPRKVETLSYRPQRDLFHWPLGAGLGLSLTYYAFLMLRLGLRHARRSRPDTAEEAIEAA